MGDRLLMWKKKKMKHRKEREFPSVVGKERWKFNKKKRRRMMGGGQEDEI